MASCHALPCHDFPCSARQALPCRGKSYFCISRRVVMIPSFRFQTFRLGTNQTLFILGARTYIPSCSQVLALWYQKLLRFSFFSCRFLVPTYCFYWGLPPPSPPCCSRIFEVFSERCSSFQIGQPSTFRLSGGCQCWD